ncbi:NAD(P)-binding protein [Xylariaceae sp. FL0594]|nr:NAD(P)-binding protein [Xylariaceae sp. FL0594]
MTRIAIVGASGKLGGATLSALLKHGLAPASEIIALTSSTEKSSQTWTRLAEKGVEVRHARFEDPATFESALLGADVFFLVSTPNIGLDFGVAMDYDGTTTTTAHQETEKGVAGPGREAHHKNAIDAAVKAGVRWIVYSSLAFGYSGGPGDASKAGVMRAHLRTEAYLRDVVSVRHGVDVTILREGLYNESWPLYLGYYEFDDASSSKGGNGEVEVVPLAGDGKICWTAIHDLGVASAVVLADTRREYVGKTAYLSTRPDTAKSMVEIAQIVGRVRAREVKVEIVGREEHVRYYTEERGLPKPAVEWWVSTYEALRDGECLVDDPTLETLLSRVGLVPIPVEDTIAAMDNDQGSWKS